MAFWSAFLLQVRTGIPNLIKYFFVSVQELLQLQYEGMSVKKMFSKVKVNVNLLLHLLNSKFYSKKK